MSTLTLWNSPFAELDAFDRLIRRAFGQSAFGTARQGSFQPAAELSRDGADAVVKVELPGVDITKDVTIEVDAGRLVVRGERRAERTSEEHGYALRELRYGTFRRSFTLPASVSAEDVSATYDAGVLTIRIAGAYAGAEPRRIAIAGATAEAEQVESGESTA